MVVIVSEYLYLRCLPPTGISQSGAEEISSEDPKPGSLRHHLRSGGRSSDGGHCGQVCPGDH